MGKYNATKHKSIENWLAIKSRAYTHTHRQKLECVIRVECGMHASRVEREREHEINIKQDINTRLSHCSSVHQPRREPFRDR